MLDFVYHTRLKLLKIVFFGMNMLQFCLEDDILLWQ